MGSGQRQGQESPGDHLSRTAPKNDNPAIVGGAVASEIDALACASKAYGPRQNPAPDSLQRASCLPQGQAATKSRQTAQTGLKMADGICISGGKGNRGWSSENCSDVEGMRRSHVGRARTIITVPGGRASIPSGTRFSTLSSDRKTLTGSSNRAFR